MISLLLLMRCCVWLCAQITDLKPDTNYVFVVRAENSQGVSIPSAMSEVVRTLSAAHSRSVPLHLINQARARLATKVILLKELTPTASTAVHVSWEVSEKKKT